MLAKIKEEITNLINKTAELIINNPEAPTDYTSLKQRVIQLELRREINTLREMLGTDDFIAAFKQHCQWRATHNEANIKINELPENPTALLYWHITLLVFQPQTMAEQLAIILPQVTTYMEVSVSDSHLYERGAIKRYLKNALPILKETPIAKALTVPPQLAILSHCVIIGSQLFNINDISHFPLKLHVYFQHYLANMHPVLAEKVYKHNISLQCLVTNILTYRQKGVPPRVALEQLSKQLSLGGKRITNNVYASSASNQAFEYFFTYFNALPSTLQKQLRALHLTHKTLGSIIDIEIEKGECTETTADLLTKILDAHKDNPILNLPPQMSDKDIKTIESLYGNQSPLDTSRNEFAVISLPIQLLKEAIPGANPHNVEDLIHLLLNFSPQLYDLLWEHLQMSSSILERLNDSIKLGFFNTQQLQALAAAIIKHRARFQLLHPLLVWAILTNDIVFVDAALTTYDDPAASICISYNNQTTLHFAVGNIVILKRLVTLIPQSQRFAILTSSTFYGKSVLQQNAAFPEIIKSLLQLLPTELLANAVTASNRSDGLNLMHCVAEYPVSMSTVLELLDSDDQRLFAISSRTKKGDTLLSLLNTHHECFQMALQLIPSAAEKYEVIMEADNNGITVLQSLTHNPQALAAALNVIPDSQKLAAILTTDKSGNTLLHKAVHNSLSLRIILETIPKPQRLALLKTQNKTGDSVLMQATHHPDSIHTIMEQLPKEWRADALKQVKELLCIGYKKSSTFISTILLLVPEQARLDVLKLPTWDNLLIQRIAPKFENIRPLIRLLPIKDRDEAVKLLNFVSYLSFIIHLKDAELFKEFIETTTADELRILLHQKDANGCEFINSLVKEVVLLQELLKAYPTYFRDQHDLQSVLMACARNTPSMKLILTTIPTAQRVEIISVRDVKGNTVLHARHIYDQSLTTLLEQVPELRRLELVTMKNSEGQSLLGISAQSFDFAHKLLLLLPGLHRYQAVTVTDSQQQSILSRNLSEIEHLKILLALLNQCPNSNQHMCHSDYLKALISIAPENDRLSMLRMTIDTQSVLDFLIKQSVVITTADEGFAESFVPDFINIYLVLTTQAELEARARGFFRNNEQAPSLLNLLNKADSFSAMKDNLCAYFEKNSHADLAQKLLRACVPHFENYEDGFVQLLQKWEIERHIPRVTAN